MADIEKKPAKAGMAGLLLNPWVYKLIWMVGITATLTGGYYLWHTKPIKDLREEVFEQGKIIEKTKEKVVDSNEDSKLFEDKWGYVKDVIIILDETKDKNGTEKSTQIDDTNGEHTISF